MGTYPIHMDFTLKVYPKGPFLNAIRLEIKALTLMFGEENTNIQ